MSMLSLRGKRVILGHDSHPDNISELLLTSRNINQEYIVGDMLHDPFLMPDMHQAVQRIIYAHKHRERVMIFGDYDVDGISSTAALFLFLRDELGIDVSYRLPHRVKDGYGMKVYHIEEIASTGTTLLITVDCGTKDIEPIQCAYELGLEVIVTDHHSCPSVLPKCVAVVNPRRHDTSYPFSGLSGSGVVWKLIHAVSSTLFPEEITQQIVQKYVDIVSLGTVADCMPMVDENRTIVRRGLAQASDSLHPFFHIFSGILHHPIKTEDDIGFFVGPMLNAGGRITTPYQSISALLATSSDAYQRIQELISVNETRKGLSRDAYERAREIIDVSSPCILYVDEKLEHGILGLVASKLCELLNRPVGVFTRDQDNYVGSFRAPIGIDLVAILDAAAPHLLQYGGHAGAAGCTISTLCFSLACDAIVSATKQLYDVSSYTPTLSVDTVVDLHQLDRSFFEQIEALRPFGSGFHAPLFMVQNVVSTLMPLGQSGQHFKWDTNIEGCDIIGFHLDDIATEISGHPLHLIGRLAMNTWRDTKTLQFQVIDVVRV